MRKIKKCCWIARESKRGWTLTFDYGFGKRSLGLFCDNEKSVKTILKAGIVFVHSIKGSKEK